jgi:hypothetical protein
VAGLHIKVTEFVKDKDCLVCGPGVLIELDASVTLEKVIFYFSGSLFSYCTLMFSEDGHCNKLLSFSFLLGHLFSCG